MTYRGAKAVAYMADYNRANRATLTRKKAERRATQREYIQRKKSVRCAGCKKKYPHWIMDFDHVRGKKLHNLSTLARRTVAWKTIDDELAKCDVVCANCHRQRTHERRQEKRNAG